MAVLKTNLAFLANPITWVIAGVIALIAGIAYLIYKVDGWGNAWEHTVKGAKLIWEAYIAYAKASFETLINGLMIGLNKIKEGWYKFKNAVGMGDENENNTMLQKIQADTEQRKKAITDSWKTVKDKALEARDEFIKAGESLKWNNKSLGDVKTSITERLGLGTTSTDNGGPTGNNETKGSKNLGKKTNDNIAAGGTRKTDINISIQNLGTDTKIYVSSANEGISNLGQKLKEELLRVVNSANQMQTM